MVLDRAAGTVRFDRPGVELDLGGIGKGYAVDRVVDLLRRRGIASALVNLGGSSVYGLGAPPGREAWEIGIQDPTDPAKTALTVRLRDRALSVSGGYERFFEKDGVTYSHIMDPAHRKSRAGRAERRGPDRQPPPTATRSTTSSSSRASTGPAPSWSATAPPRRCSSCRNPAAAGGSSASEAEARAGASGSPGPGRPRRARARAGRRRRARALLAEVGLVESAAGSENAGHVRPLPLRHLAAAAEPLELGQNVSSGEETGSSLPPSRAAGRARSRARRSNGRSRETNTSTFTIVSR